LSGLFIQAGCNISWAILGPAIELVLAAIRSRSGLSGARCLIVLSTGGASFCQDLRKKLFIVIKNSPLLQHAYWHNLLGNDKKNIIAMVDKFGGYPSHYQVGKSSQPPFSGGGWSNLPVVGGFAFAGNTLDLFSQPVGRPCLSRFWKDSGSLNDEPTATFLYALT